MKKETEKICREISTLTEINKVNHVREEKREAITGKHIKNKNDIATVTEKLKEQLQAKSQRII